MRVRFITVLIAVVAVVATVVGALPAAASAVGVQPSLLTTPTPAGTANSVLDGVTCPSGTDCVAVGSAQTGGYHRTALVETWNGSAWTITASGLFPDLKPATLAGVSCADAGACVAVGVGTTANATGSHSAEVRPIALREVDGTWHTSRPVITSGKLTVDELDRIDCPTASDCEAIGSGIDEGRAVAVVERLAGANWSVAVISLLSGTSETAADAIGCSSATDCLVTEDGRIITPGKAASVAGLLSLASGKWHPVKLADPRQIATTSVSCPTGGSCSAFAYDTSTAALEQLSATGTITSLPAPATFGTEAVPIEGLSCAAQDQCLGLGQAGEKITNHVLTARGTTVAETYDGSAFSTAFTGLPLRLEQVTCQPTFCMFVGSHARTTASALWSWPTATATGD